MLKSERISRCWQGTTTQYWTRKRPPRRHNVSSVECRSATSDSLGRIHPYGLEVNERPEDPFDLFPLTPFLASLGDDFRLGLGEYRRISVALRAGGPWDLPEDLAEDLSQLPFLSTLLKDHKDVEEL